MKECSDQELILRLTGGDNLALNEIMTRYKQRLFAFIYRYLRNETAAYDLLQETFTKLYFSAHTYKPEYTFSTWLFQIALNLCRDHGRKKKLAQFFSIDDEATTGEIIDASPNPEMLAQSSQGVKYISDAIEMLPHKLKVALILFSIEGYSQEECAKLLNTTPKTVETRVYRARKLLEEKLFKKGLIF
ncbi:MAG: sigma-70 family RNA polymerase sigma factor [Alphaproteobacteria bacterium]|nr:sigma-70 family RNA polymerase sigma factor [Alphaproteobacteria bacterium]